MMKWDRITSEHASKIIVYASHVVKKKHSQQFLLNINDKMFPIMNLSYDKLLTMMSQTFISKAVCKAALSRHLLFTVTRTYHTCVVLLIKDPSSEFWPVIYLSAFATFS